MNDIHTIIVEEEKKNTSSNLQAKQRRRRRRRTDIIDYVRLHKYLSFSSFKIVFLLS